MALYSGSMINADLLHNIMACSFQSYRRPLNPTDPNSGSVMIECGLPAVVSGIRGGAKLPAMLEVQATPAEAETKEKSNKKGTIACI